MELSATYSSDSRTRCSSSEGSDLLCNTGSLARAVVAAVAAAVAAENGSACSDMATGCWDGVNTRFERQIVVDLVGDAADLVIVELDAPAAVLDRAGLDAAAWRTDVSC